MTDTKDRPATAAAVERLARRLEAQGLEVWLTCAGPGADRYARAAAEPGSGVTDVVVERHQLAERFDAGPGHPFWLVALDPAFAVSRAVQLDEYKARGHHVARLEDAPRVFGSSWA